MRMRSSTSLTDAVKLAATSDASLTDAVKSAAREGADRRVISFPRDTAFPGATAIDDGHDGSQGGRHPWGPAPGAENRAMRVPRMERAPDARAAGFPRRAAGDKRELRRAPAPRTWRLPTAPLRWLTSGARLAGIAFLSFLSLAATPSMVGPEQAPLAAAQQRVALVIGNSAYRHTRELHNPRNDATDIGAALRKYGFRVIEGFDLDKTALDAKIREFTAALRGAEVGAFFYAGHGLHAAGQNYLVPIDAQLSPKSSLDRELVRLDLVHSTMEREAKTNLLFFDACRDNPLSDNLARAMGTRSVAIGRGLALIQSSAGTLISFSTQPGTLALDGKGRNSPYSAALLEQLTTSSDDLATMLIAVRKKVMKQTGGKQVPWEHSALTERFYFQPAADARAPAVAASVAYRREAFEAWSAIKDSKEIGVLEAFIGHYEDTFYATVARARIDELKKLGPAPKVDRVPDGPPLSALSGGPVPTSLQ